MNGKLKMIIIQTLVTEKTVESCVETGHSIVESS